MPCVGYSLSLKRRGRREVLRVQQKPALRSTLPSHNHCNDRDNQLGAQTEATTQYGASLLSNEELLSPIKKATARRATSL